MFGWIFEKIFGTKNNRIIKKYQKTVDEINSLEQKYEKLSDKELKDCTKKFQKDLKENNKKLDDLLPDAFAAVREAAKRALGKRHYDVQLMGGIALHHGKIAEMQTGEGKTLVATLAAYLNALPEQGVHIVTVNDYLAKRDATWMGSVYLKLGMTTGHIIPGMDDNARQAAYNCDITYCTNSELGFDYLRDNMKNNIDSLTQRPLKYAIIDEVDSILIDEARTPLIISGQVNQNCDLYILSNYLVDQLSPEDYELKEKCKSVHLMDSGAEKIEAILKGKNIINPDTNLYSTENLNILHCVTQSLKANIAFKKDKDYLVKNDKVLIIDEFTGRIMDKRRYSDGLHQAIEAKENVDIEPENQTLASISFQNYFRMYPKLAGMTGTAITEADEFKEIYNLDVVQIPTNMPNRRTDLDDLIYMKKSAKLNAIVDLIKDAHKAGQPILIGVTSVEKSEELSTILKKNKIKHNVLNAKNHAKEAEIIDQAGKKGSVTIATNMAGRGTDIHLGGNPESEQQNKEKIAKEAKEIEELGGLLIIGTERNESRRVDNQLRGRSGRQGSIGTTQFFLSLEDDLMCIFGGERLHSIMSTLGIKDDEVISHKWVTSALDSAQKKVESYNYELRKNLIKYDDVINDQRKNIYEQRNFIINGNNSYDLILNALEDTIDNLIDSYMPSGEYIEETKINMLQDEINTILLENIPLLTWIREDQLNSSDIIDKLKTIVTKKIDEFISSRSKITDLESIFKEVMLHAIDHEWKNHLLTLDIVKKSSSLRAYAQKNPLNEYKREAFSLFTNLTKKINNNIIYSILTIINIDEKRNISDKDTKIDNKKTDANNTLNYITENKVNRNDPCPCGSELRYKHCHGKI